MSSVALRLENLGKFYRIGPRERYRALRDVLTHAISLPFRRLGRDSEPSNGEPKSAFIWALRNVSLEVKQGEIVGIIGRNGAGKTTLLRILSRITEPTEGYAEVYGRVGSLLEVGTGFHPELTGRENLYLNGAILGMKKAEIDRRFDEIVAFAEVEKFLDTPVKHYSVGMHVRLAFAVAAHVQPEILLIDEVLAVGDVEFQKKCIGRVEKVAHEGRTVAIVSHSMATVRALCGRAILLEQGRVKTIGPADTVVTEYLRDNKAAPAVTTIRHEDHRTGVKQMRVQRISLLNSPLGACAVYWRQPISVAVELQVMERIENVAVGAGIRALDGTHIFTVHHDQEGAHPLWSFEPGDYVIQFTLENNLAPGMYRLDVGADQGHNTMKNVFLVDSVILEVLDHTAEGGTRLPSLTGVVNGSSAWTAPTRVA